jgi:hypothetical protein
MLKIAEFEYPKISVDDSDSRFIKIDNGSIVYWFSKDGEIDHIQDSLGTILVESRVMSLSTISNTFPISGKVSLEKIDDYHVVITRLADLRVAKGQVVVKYDISGERTKIALSIKNDSLLDLNNLLLAWENSVKVSSVMSAYEDRVVFAFSKYKYFGMDWSDVVGKFGKVVSSSLSSKSAIIRVILPDIISKGELLVDPTDEFTSAGSFHWTCPSSVSSVTAIARGGGGGGGGTYQSNKGGGGGGGGAYAVGIVGVSAGVEYDVVVGAAGGGGPYAGDGTDGGQSYFKDAATVAANGGGHGHRPNTYTGGPGGTVAAGSGYVGGKGADGAPSISGGGGEGAGSTSVGGAGTQALPGVGGSGTDGGDGGGGGGPTTDSGDPGTAPGGGGGGGYEVTGSTAGGGNGAPGSVVLTYEPSVSLAFFFGANF